LLQNGANLRDALRILIADLPSVRNAAQVSENARKNSFLNYKSAALPAELCRQTTFSQVNAVDTRMFVFAKIGSGIGSIK
jgi:hypothetical protein